MKNYIAQHQERFIEELIELLKIPSVSTDLSHKGDVKRAADLLKHYFEKSGVDFAEICETAGHPIVYAEKIIDKTKPTVLVYGHYDVQPADPLPLWTSPPFEPVVKEGKIYARGACDDKGQMFMHVKAFEAMVNTGTLTCNVKFMIEGEEEIGSEHLQLFVQENKARLAADIILISDTSMLSNDTPSITMGLRGLSYMEVELTGPNRDLHSGLYGGGVANPINMLAKIIASLTDENNRITIPGFYDKVRPLSPQERQTIAEIPFSAQRFKDSIGISEEVGEAGYSTLERTGVRPTLDANGIWGGYTDEGAKTVIPSKAYAKISMRLVPDQSSEEISKLFTEHIHRIVPQGVSVKVTAHHGGEPIVFSTDSLYFRAASQAYTDTFGKAPIPTRDGGSIPIVAMFKKELNLDSMLMGFGLDTDAIHSPNENFGIFNYLKGIETIPLFYKYLAEFSA